MQYSWLGDFGGTANPLAVIDAKHRDFKLSRFNRERLGLFPQNPATLDNPFLLTAHKSVATVHDIQLNIEPMLRRHHPIFYALRMMGHLPDIMQLDFEQFWPTGWGPTTSTGYMIYENTMRDRSKPINDETRRQYADEVEQKFRKPVLDEMFSLGRLIFGAYLKVAQYQMIPLSEYGKVTDVNAHPIPAADYNVYSPGLYFESGRRDGMSYEGQSKMFLFATKDRDRSKPFVPWIPYPGFAGPNKPLDRSNQMLAAWYNTFREVVAEADDCILWGSPDLRFKTGDYLVERLFSQFGSH